MVAPRGYVLTPDQALAGRSYASYGRRAVAYVLDLLAFLLLSITLIGIVVPFVMMARDGEHNGMTLGKQVMGIRVIRQDGRPVTVWTAILRYLAATVLGLALFVGTVIDLLFPLWDSHKQTLHDKWVKTFVVSG